MRGCNLKIGSIVYGVAIYTGKDTKMIKNTKFKPNKLSCIEKRLNTFVFFFLGILALMVILCLIGSIIYSQMYNNVWYLSNRSADFFESNRFIYYLIVIILYATIFNYIIPLSLYVTVGNKIDFYIHNNSKFKNFQELQRFVGSKFLEWDLEYAVHDF